MRGKLFGINAILADGCELSGYVGEQNRYVVIFAGADKFVLSDDTPDEERRLGNTVAAKVIRPIQIYNRVTGERWVYS